MAFRFIGVSSTAITDGGSQAPTINGQTWSTSNLLNGDTCMYNYGRFMWNKSTGKWVGQGDVNIHSDVQSALNDIIIANKGEEVRGSIYDALALVDARTDMLDQDIRKDANNIVHSEFGFSIQFDLKGAGETSKSSKTIAQINEALALNKCIIANVKYGGEWRYSMTCVVQVYSASAYEMTVYAPTDDGENIEIFEIISSGWTNVTYTRTVVPISGGGGGSSDNYNLIFTVDYSLTSGTCSCNLTYQELLNLIDAGIKKPIIYLVGSGPMRLGGDANIYKYTEDNVTKIMVKVSEMPKYGTANDIMEQYAFVYTSSSLTFSRVQINYQQKLTPGTGISIDPTTNTISLDLPQAEGGGF